MDEHTLTWRGEVHGEIKIYAESASEAQKKLEDMTYEELVKTSKIWKNEKPVSIECVDTKLGLFEKEAWEEIY